MNIIEASEWITQGGYVRRPEEAWDIGFCIGKDDREPGEAAIYCDGRDNGGNDCVFSLSDCLATDFEKCDRNGEPLP